MAALATVKDFLDIVDVHRNQNHTADRIRTVMKAWRLSSARVHSNIFPPEVLAHRFFNLGATSSRSVFGRVSSVIHNLDGQWAAGVMPPLR